MGVQSSRWLLAFFRVSFFRPDDFSNILAPPDAKFSSRWGSWISIRWPLLLTWTLGLKTDPTDAEMDLFGHGTFSLTTFKSVSGLARLYPKSHST